MKDGGQVSWLRSSGSPNRGPSATPARGPEVNMSANEVRTSAMASAPTRIVCSSVAELRALCATGLERAPSARVFDNRLQPTLGNPRAAEARR